MSVPTVPFHINPSRYIAYILYLCINICNECREELDAKIQENNPNDGIIIAKVDATKSTTVAGRFQIRSYPSLKYYADRKMYTYKGVRTLEALYEFATEGYKTASDDPIPAAPSAFELKMKELREKLTDYTQKNEHLKYLLEDFEHITDYRKNAAIVLVVMGSIIGFMLGVIVTLLIGINGNKSKAAKKKKE